MEYQTIDSLEKEIDAFAKYRQHELMRRRLAEQAEQAEMDRLGYALGKAVLYARYQLNIGDYAVFRYVYLDVIVRVGRIVGVKCLDSHGDLYVDMIPAHREDQHISALVSLTVRKGGTSLSPQDDRHSAQIIPDRYVSAAVLELMPEVHREAYATYIYGAK